MRGLNKNALAELMSDNSESGVNYQAMPENYLMNNRTGEVTEFGQSQRSNGLGEVGRRQNPDGSLTVYERVAGTDGFGRQSARVVERTIVPDYMNPTVKMQMEHRKRVAELQKAESEAGGKGNAPTGYRWKADGTGVERIPGMEETKPTEFEGKSAAFGTRALQAHNMIEKINTEKGVTTPSMGNQFAGAVSELPVVGGLVGGGLRKVTNQFATPEEQQIEQAMLQFRNATLRQESGAAIGDGEHAGAIRQYFPEPGDDAATIEAKRQAREAVIRGFEVTGGKTYDKTIEAAGVPTLGQQQAPQQRQSPTFAQLPNPAPFKGKKMRGDQGEVYFSDGTKWIPMGGQ